MKTRTNSSQKTAGFRDKMRIGANLANQLQPRMGAKECADKFGISATMLRRIECLALFKVQARLLDIKAQEQV